MKRLTIKMVQYNLLQGQYKNKGIPMNLCIIVPTIQQMYLNNTETATARQPIH